MNDNIIKLSNLNKEEEECKSFSDFFSYLNKNPGKKLTNFVCFNARLLQIKQLQNYEEDKYYEDIFLNLNIYINIYEEFNNSISVTDEVLEIIKNLDVKRLEKLVVVSEHPFLVCYSILLLQFIKISNENFDFNPIYIEKFMKNINFLKTNINIEENLFNYFLYIFLWNIKKLKILEETVLEIKKFTNEYLTTSFENKNYAINTIKIFFMLLSSNMLIKAKNDCQIVNSIVIQYFGLDTFYSEVIKSQSKSFQSNNLYYAIYCLININDKNSFNENNRKIISELQKIIIFLLKKNLISVSGICSNLNEFLFSTINLLKENKMLSKDLYQHLIYNYYLLTTNESKQIADNINNRIKKLKIEKIKNHILDNNFIDTIAKDFLQNSETISEAKKNYWQKNCKITIKNTTDGKIVYSKIDPIGNDKFRIVKSLYYFYTDEFIKLYKLIINYNYDENLIIDLLIKQNNKLEKYKFNLSIGIEEFFKNNEKSNYIAAECFLNIISNFFIDFSLDKTKGSGFKIHKNKSLIDTPLLGVILSNKNNFNFLRDEDLQKNIPYHFINILCSSKGLNLRNIMSHDNIDELQKTPFISTWLFQLICVIAIYLK